MSITEMRKQMTAAYPASPTWAERVARMSDNQIFAVYTRMKMEGKIK